MSRGSRSDFALDDDEVATLLQRADIILTHGGGLVSALIRWATRSYWNHVAMVFVLSDEASGERQGYRRTFVIEAEPHGIDIHPIDKYLYNQRQDMVILRLPDGAIPEGIRTDFLRRARGFALEEIDAGYGFSAIGGIMARFFGAMTKPLAFLVAAGNLLFRTPGVPRVVNRWICSGVVQYAYYRACFGADPASGPMWDNSFTDMSRRSQVVFNPDARTAIAQGLSFKEAEAMLRLTTPGHFALAATYGELQPVGERIAGRWSIGITRP